MSANKVNEFAGENYLEVSRAAGRSCGKEPSQLSVASRSGNSRRQHTLDGRPFINPRNPFSTRQPTCQLQSKNPIDIEYVQYLVKRCTLHNLQNFVNYDPEKAAEIAEELGRDIRTRIKLLNYDRYKIIVTVNIVEKAHQSLHWKIGFLWEHECDLWTYFQHEAQSYVLTAIVCGVYWN